jgi:hypothetical protein
MIKEKHKPIPSKGWAEMIRKVYEVDSLICPRCGGRMKVVSFLTEYAVVDRIIRHLKYSDPADPEFLTPFCSREYHHFVRVGAYFGPDGSDLSDAQKRNFLSLIVREDGRMMS